MTLLGRGMAVVQMDSWLDHLDVLEDGPTGLADRLDVRVWDSRSDNPWGLSPGRGMLLLAEVKTAGKSSLGVWIIRCSGPGTCILCRRCPSI